MRLAAPMVVALATLVFQLPFFDRWFNFMDEGHMLLFADIVAQGGELYRDATLYPLPGAFYLLAGFFAGFEPSILLSRWIVVVQFSLFVAAIFVWLRGLVSLPYALLGVSFLWLYRVWAFPHWQIYSYSTTALLVQVLGMLLLLQFFITRRRLVLGLAGFVFGLGVLCKQDYGAAALLAIGATLLVHFRSEPKGERGSILGLYATFILPAAFVGLATAAHFLRQGLLDDLLRFTVFNHFVGMSSYEYMEFPALFPLFTQDPVLRQDAGIVGYMPGIMFTADWDTIQDHYLINQTALYDTLLKFFYYGPFAVLAGGGLRLWRRRDSLEQPSLRQRYLGEFLLFAFSAGLILLVWLNRPQDYLHLAVLYWPLLVLCTFYLHDFLARNRRRLAVVLLAALLPATALVGYTTRLVWLLRESNSAPLSLQRGGVKVQPTEAHMLETVVEYIVENSQPDQTVAVLPYFPILQFLADRRGPHRSSYIVWPFAELSDRDERVIQGMEINATQLVIYNYTQFQSFPPLEEYAPQLFSYLVDTFETERVFTFDDWGYKLAALSRRRDSELADLRLVSEGEDPMLRVWPPEGPPLPIPPERVSQYLAAEKWPFRPAWAVHAPGDGGRTEFSVPLSVPRGARLRTAVMIYPNFWYEVPPYWTRFEISVQKNETRELLHSSKLNPTHEYADRGWIEIEVPLEAYAGEHVVLHFTTRGEKERKKQRRRLIAAWAEPRIWIAPADG